MLSHDQTAFAITKLYPEWVHGRDFWVAHPVKAGSAEQLGEVEIKAWPEGVKQPDRKTLQKTFEAHADEFYAQRARERRDAELKQSDWTQLLDTPPAIRERWAEYRRALCDLPKQQGFPHQIDWPKKP